MIKNNVPSLATVYLYFSSACNLCCRHCWIEPGYLASGKANQDLAVDKIISALEECLPLGLKEVKITGGEPFLRKDVFGLLEYLVSKKTNISIETNATLIGPKEARAIKKARVYHVAVSLDGPTKNLHEKLRQIKGSFKDAVSGIGHLKKAGVGNIQIIMSLWRENAPALKRMVSFARGLGVNSLKINPVAPSCNRAEKMKEEQQLLSIKEILKLYQGLRKAQVPQKGFRVFFDLPPALLSFEDLKRNRDSRCGIKNLLGILADGKISICGIGETVDKLVLGEVGKDKIGELWKNNRILKQIREEIPSKLEGVCGRCMFKFFCLGKCRAAMFYNTENLLSPFLFCQEAEELGLFPKNRLLS